MAFAFSLLLLRLNNSLVDNKHDEQWSSNNKTPKIFISWKLLFMFAFSLEFERRKKNNEPAAKEEIKMKWEDIEKEPNHFTSLCTAHACDSISFSLSLTLTWFCNYFTSKFSPTKTKRERSGRVHTLLYNCYYILWLHWGKFVQIIASLRSFPFLCTHCSSSWSGGLRSTVYFSL